MGLKDRIHVQELPSDVPYETVLRASVTVAATQTVETGELCNPRATKHFKDRLVYTIMHSVYEHPERLFKKLIDTYMQKHSSAKTYEESMLYREMAESLSNTLKELYE